MSEFTKGPWVVPAANVFRVLAVSDHGEAHRLILDGCPDGYYGRCELKWGDDDGPEMAANARLIAAAPDLLAACELAVQFWYSDHPNDTVEGHTALKTIKAAIAAAKGETNAN